MRTASLEQLELAVKRFGADRAGIELRRRGLLPPIAGGSGLAIDVSTPAFVQGTSASTITTAAFTPPNGALLVILWCQGQNNADYLSSVSNTGGGVTWEGSATVQKIQSSACAADIWYGTVTSSASMTVSMTMNAGGGWYAGGVVVVTGQAASPIGATNTSGSASGAPSCTIASLTGSNSLVMGVVGDNNNNTSWTMATNCSDTFNGHSFTGTSQGAGWAEYDTRMNLAAGSSDTLSATVPATTEFAFAMVEILAAGGGSPPPTPIASRQWPQAMWRSAYR